MLFFLVKDIVPDRELFFLFRIKGETMIRLFIMALISCGIGMVCQGCSYKAWKSGLYTGFQEEQKRRCYDNPNQSDIQKCLERVNGMSYDDYNKYREETVNRSK